MTVAERACAIAAAEVGVTEVPSGSNRGPRVQAYQAATSLGGTGWPWCAAFVAWVWTQAGIPADVVDEVCTASTALNCSIARQRELVCPPRPGVAIVWCGTHTELLYTPLGRDVWRCVGGNTADGVFWRTRSVAGALVYAPPGLGDAQTLAAPERLLWLEDLRAQYEVKGPWDSRLGALRVYRGLRPATRRRAKLVQTGDDRYAIRIGQARHLGPWVGPGAAEGRARAKARIEAQRRRRLREYSTTRLPRVPSADDLGKVD